MRDIDRQLCHLHWESERDASSRVRPSTSKVRPRRHRPGKLARTQTRAARNARYRDCRAARIPPWPRPRGKPIRRCNPWPAGAPASTTQGGGGWARHSPGSGTASSSARCPGHRPAAARSSRTVVPWGPIIGEPQSSILLGAGHVPKSRQDAGAAGTSGVIPSFQQMWRR